MQGKAADRFSRSSRVETMLRGCTVLCGLSTYAPYLLLPKVVSLFGASVCFRFRARPCITPATCTISHRICVYHTCGERATEHRIIGRDGTKNRSRKKISNFNLSIVGTRATHVADWPPDRNGRSSLHGKLRKL